MKVQLFGNYAAVTKNYQAEKINQQPKMTCQQSFGRVIVDNRGMENIVGRDLKKLLKTTLKNIKRVMDPKLIESEKQDILIYPFQVDRSIGGIAVCHPYENGEKGIAVSKFYTDEAISAEDIKAYISHNLPETTTFKRVARESIFPNYFWNIEKQLPESEIKKRFNKAA